VHERLTALDVALVLPPALIDALTSLNASLLPAPDGFHFDATHVPHLTLVQQFSPLEALQDIADDITTTAQHTAPLQLTTGRLSKGETAVVLTVEHTQALHDLHHCLMERLEKFDRPSGDTTGFVNTSPGGSARTRDVAWVRKFRRNASYDAFTPHITLGVGHLDQPSSVRNFTATHLGLYQLGRFCTCRRLLQSFTLNMNPKRSKE